MYFTFVTSQYPHRSLDYGLWYWIHGFKWPDSPTPWVTLVSKTKICPYKLLILLLTRMIII